MNHRDTQALIERYLAAYNTFDIDGMLALLSADVRFENHANGQLGVATDGLAAFRELAEQSRSLFAEREQRITGIAFGEHAATVEIAFRGVLAVDLPDGPAAGTVIELQGQSAFDFEGERICRIVDRS